MSLGWQEVMLIMVFALLVFGPRRLPDIARQIGRALREVRKVSSEFEREVKTSFALDEHHSSYVVPTSEKPEPAETADGETGEAGSELGTPEAGEAEPEADAPEAGGAGSDQPTRTAPEAERPDAG